MDSVGECRICCLQGQYNIFNDEVCFDPKNNSKLKIYIVLNNFLFEKLYSQDEYSSFICTMCCDDLCNSYTFMIKVRKAEQNLRLETRRESVSNTNSSLRNPYTNAPVKKYPIKSIEPDSSAISKEQDIQEDVLEISEGTIEEVLDEVEVYKKEDSQDQTPENNEGFDYEVEEKLEETKEVSHCQYVELIFDTPNPTEPIIKKQKKAPSSKAQMPLAITYTHYELVAYKENNQNVIVLNTYPAQMKLPKSGIYEFDTSWINHKPKEPTIFKCKHCVKAFSSVEFLLKHNLSCHLCLNCSQTFEGYKELTQHSREHSAVICHFCDKFCGSSSNFRQHLKKQHLLQFPPQIGILKNPSD